MKDIIQEDKGDYQTITQVFEGVIEIKGGFRHAQQSIIIQKHKPTRRIKWLLIKEGYDKGKVWDWEYFRCHHNAHDQLTFFEHVKRYKGIPQEGFKAKLIYEDREVVGYRDGNGNEWKREWTPENPFDIERETLKYYHMAHTALRFWEVNMFFYMGLGGRIWVGDDVIPQ